MPVFKAFSRHRPKQGAAGVVGMSVTVTLGYHTNMQDHHHEHHGHHYHGGTSESKRLIMALWVIFGFALVEAVAGALYHSVALYSDAGHMLSDAAALAVAVAASVFSSRPPSIRHSYGLARLEVIGALANGIMMLLVVGFIAYLAIGRLFNPQPVNGLAVIVVVGLGLLVNIVVYYLLHHEDASLNARAALLHVMADLLGSVAALLAGIIIYFSNWYAADPLLSLAICVLILVSTVGLLRRVLVVLLEAVPGHLDLVQVGLSMAELQGVQSVHDLHIWSLSSGQTMLSAHIVVDSLDQWPGVFQALVYRLSEEYHIDHVTLQPEPETYRLTRMDPGAATNMGKHK